MYFFILRLAGQSQPFIASIHQAGATPGTSDKLRAGGTSYPSLWRTWNSRCVMNLTGQVEERPAPGSTKELIRGSPVPVRARDDSASPVFGAQPPRDTVRKFTMDQFQKEFGPCLTYTAPASPLRKHMSVESTETIPLSGPHPRLVAQPASGVPATLGRGGWRPVIGQFSLDSASRRCDERRFGDSSTLPLARKPLSALENMSTDTRWKPPVKFTEPVYQAGLCCCCFAIKA